MAAAFDMTINARVLCVAACLVTAVVLIILGSMLPNEFMVRQMFFGDEDGLIWPDENGNPKLHIPYPLTIQNLMWPIFFWGVAEIITRHFQTNRDMEPISARLLPEDRETMLRAGDLGPFYRRVNEGGFSEGAFLPRLITRTILQFQSSRSVSQANSLLNSTLELCQHEVELRYNTLRFLVWLLPTLGFIGTVLGISSALGSMGGVDFNDTDAMKEMMPKLTSHLGVAFYSTLLALLQSAILVFALHLTQAREELVLNRAGQYCLDNLINRLWDK